MTEEKQSHTLLFIILIGIALFTPYFIFIGELTTVVAVTWTLLIHGRVQFIFLEQTVMSMPFWILRVLFVVQTYRFYNGETTEGSVLKLGLLSESVMFIFFNVGSIAILWDPTWPLDPRFPIPLLFIIVYILLKFRPPFAKEDSWPELED